MVKLNTIRMSFLGYLVMCWPYALQAQNDPLHIQLRAISSTTVEITEANTSKQNIDFPCGNPSMKIYVTKRDGTAAEDTDEGVRYKVAGRGGRSNKQSVCVSGSLKPGQSVKYPLDVSRFYKLPDDSGYSVTVEHDVEGIPVARSNSVTLTAK